MRINVPGIIMSAAALTALLAGCGSETPAAKAPASASSTAGQHNKADVDFASNMVPHHQQALAMTKLVPKHSTGKKLLALAGQIDKAQQPEITQMQGWLAAWKAAMPDMHGGMNMSHDGMMSDSEMSQLAAKHGAEFDRMWLTMMIRHHQGAVDMANTESRSGQNTDAKALATRIISSQQAEIHPMHAMLG